MKCCVINEINKKGKGLKIRNQKAFCLLYSGMYLIYK